MNKFLARASKFEKVTHKAAEATVDHEFELKATVTVLSLDAVVDRNADTRPVNWEHVVSVAESIAALGLLQPPAVDKEHRLVAGLHRLTACRMLASDAVGRVALVEAEPDLVERVKALPALEELPEPLLSGNIPVRVLTDLDSTKDIDRAVAAEAAENTARRQYTAKEVESIKARLIDLGYSEVRGRPRAGQKPLKPALSLVLGLGVRQLRRLDGGKVGHVTAFSGKDLEISAAKSLKKAVSKFSAALVGQKGTNATEKRVALEAVQEAVAELLKLVEGEEYRKSFL
jgi:ParB-like chromosome segregation protein Spo0J